MRRNYNSLWLLAQKFTDIDVDSSASLERAISVPYSLRNTSLMVTDNVLKDLVTNYLKITNRNINVKNLLLTETDYQREKLIESFLSIKPFTPRVMSAIHSVSNINMVDQFRTRFEKGSTIVSLISLNE